MQEGTEEAIDKANLVEYLPDSDYEVDGRDTAWCWNCNSGGALPSFEDMNTTKDGFEKAEFQTKKKEYYL